MASKVIVSDRVRGIAEQLRSACLPTMQPELERNELRDQLNAAADNVRSVRLTIMLRVAQMSRDGKWLPGEITQACKAAAAMGNQSDDKAAKSLATFISEMKNVADPNVRDQFAAMVAACESAWQKETDAIAAAKANKADPPATPLRKLFARSYHMVTHFTRHVKEHGGSYTSADAIVRWAEANDPDLDAARVEKRLQSIVDQLQAVFHDFPHDDVKVCVEYLGVIKAADLIRARQAVHGMVASAGTHAPAPAPTQAPAEASTTGVNDTVEPPDGAVDVFDEVLADIAGDELRLAA